MKMREEKLNALKIFLMERPIMQVTIVFYLFMIRRV